MAPYPAPLPATVDFDTAPLEGLIGRASRLAETGYAVVRIARDLRASSVATLLVTCSDEREKECADAFQNTVVRELCKGTFGRRGPFRTANLGGRYEWGAVDLATNHFTSEEENQALLVASIHSHVGMAIRDGRFAFGQLEREQRTTPACGALCAFLDGARAIFTEDLEQLFAAEGIDRVELLNDPAVTPPEHRALLAAVINARAQARKAMLDLSEASLKHPDHAAARALVLASVTINRPQADQEILVGFYAGGRPAPDAPLGFRWVGLCDDPRELEVHLTHDRLEVRSHGGDVEHERARDPRAHRAAPLELWDQATPDGPAPQRLRDVVREAAVALEDRLHDGKHPLAAFGLRAMALGLAELLPVPGVLMLFGGGAIDLHHAWRMERLARGQANEHEARQALHDLARRAGRMSEADARAQLEKVLAALGAEYPELAVVQAEVASAEPVDPAPPPLPGDGA